MVLVVVVVVVEVLVVRAVVVVVPVPSSFVRRPTLLQVSRLRRQLRRLYVGIGRGSIWLCGNGGSALAGAGRAVHLTRANYDW